MPNLFLKMCPTLPAFHRAQGQTRTQKAQEISGKYQTWPPNEDTAVLIWELPVSQEPGVMRPLTHDSVCFVCDTERQPTPELGKRERNVEAEGKEGWDRSRWKTDGKVERSKLEQRQTPWRQSDTRKILEKLMLVECWTPCRPLNAWSAWIHFTSGSQAVLVICDFRKNKCVYPYVVFVNVGFCSYNSIGSLLNKTINSPSQRHSKTILLSNLWVSQKPTKFLYIKRLFSEWLILANFSAAIQTSMICQASCRSHF